ncbi:MAG: PqqD family peptide modification chaperone [Gammaproteobacteria bacterium]|nr:PqqD family peptide modification chaperone [Gammaproteobacteria bacterium]
MDAGALSAELVSSHWYRVAGIAPRLRDQLRIHAHRYRGQPWFVVEDRLNGKFHRFDHLAWRILRLLDGTRTLEALWQQLAAEGGEDTPSQEDLLALLGQLHGLDLLASDTLPDLAELARRERRVSRQKRLSRYLNPLALRLPLVDPDRFLGRVVARFGPALERWGVWIWLVCVLPAVPLAAQHWRELTGNFGERLLAFDNLLLLGLVFPLVKGLHELGHGLACKLRGGEVHDMGVMLLIFLPVPYVEASSAWAFPDKHARALVGAAGMLVEIMLAALAFYLWLWLEPGTTKALVYDVVVLASVTTLVFNGNPLLRYDGYYIASDLLEIPNLAQRAGRYWGYLVERYVLRQTEAASPALAPGEAAWFTFYAPLAFAYRCFVMFSISIFVATQYFAVGVFIAIWSLVMSLGLPLWRALSWFGRAMAGRRTGSRARRAGLAFAVVLAIAFYVVPLPLHTQVDGVLSLPEDAMLRAGQSGFVAGVALPVDAEVAPGTEVLKLEDPTLAAHLEAQRARVEAARVRYDAVRLSEPVLAAEFLPALAHARTELADLEARAAQLTVKSGARGRVWLDRRDDLPGRHLRQGDVVGYVLPAGAPHVRVIVDQHDQDFIRGRTREVNVKVPFAADALWRAGVLRAVPAASHELPSPALGRQGGGAVATDPRDDTGKRALVSHFEYELTLPAAFPYQAIGSHVSVRFEHAPEPLGYRLQRTVRRLFLAYFHA